MKTVALDIVITGKDADEMLKKVRVHVIDLLTDPQLRAEVELSAWELRERDADEPGKLTQTREGMITHG